MNQLNIEMNMKSILTNFDNNLQNTEFKLQCLKKKNKFLMDNLYK